MIILQSRKNNFYSSLTQLVNRTWKQRIRNFCNYEQIETYFDTEKGIYICIYSCEGNDDIFQSSFAYIEIYDSKKSKLPISVSPYFYDIFYDDASNAFCCKYDFNDDYFLIFFINTGGDVIGFLYLCSKDKENNSDMAIKVSNLNIFSDDFDMNKVKEMLDIEGAFKRTLKKGSE